MIAFELIPLNSCALVALQPEQGAMMDSRKQTIIAMLDKFIRQRPGLEFGNYGDVSAYRSELRGITKDLNHARAMLRAVEWSDISADAIIDAAKHAYSGRLSITENEPGKFKLDYCTGQYWPTEYRRAVCAVLASALWDHWRDVAHNESNIDKREYGSLGADLRSIAKRELGRSIANRWFN